MSSITNLRRDMKWIGEPTNMALGTANTTLKNTQVRSDAVLNPKHGYIQTDVLNAAGAAGSWYGFGTYLTWRNDGTTPFRIKAHCSVDAHWGFGWRAGSDEFGTPAAHRFCAFGKLVDDVWAIRERTSWSNHNVIFYGFVPADAGEFVLDLAVQSLHAEPDQFNGKVK